MLGDGGMPVVFPPPVVVFENREANMPRPGALA
jgi:hypothetical protein